MSLDGVILAPGGKDEDRDGGYVTHAEAFEPMHSGDPFGDRMNAPKKYVVSRTLESQSDATRRSFATTSSTRCGR
jgi:hypothetical protein